MHFGGTLKLLRVEAGLSLRALARRVGVSSAYLSRVENGHDPAPTPDRLTAIATALQLPPDTLVELAQQTAPALTEYIQRVPGAGALFLEVARRDLDAAQLARLREVLDAEFPPPPARAGAPAPLSSLIGDRVALRAPCTDIDAIIAAATALCGGRDRTRSAELARLVREREALVPTIVGKGVAVPHAIVPGARTEAALVTLAEPLAYGGSGATPIELAVVVISTEAGRAHLETLAQVARLASHGIAADLRAARTRAQALAAIVRLEAL